MSEQRTGESFVTRLTTPAAGLAAAALMLLTACGGGSGDNGSDKISATQTTATGTASASSTASATPTVQRPVITFPSYAKNVFEDEHTGDPKKDAVLADDAQGVNSIDDAIFRRTLDSSALRFYNTGTALQNALSYIQGYLDKNQSWAGTTRYFDRKVTFGDDGSASVVYCADGSESWTTPPATPATHAPATADSYSLFNDRLEQNEQGVWQIVNGVSKPGATECQP